MNYAPDRAAKGQTDVLSYFSLPRVRISRGLLIAAACISLAPPVAVAQITPPLRILLANDDGIGAPGLAVLAEALADLGDVSVFAPSTNRSGSSLALEMRGSTEVERFERDGRFFGYGVASTPAGAMMVGLEHALAAGQPFDLVVSGINRGANVGDLGHFSGTVGSAMIGAYYGVPAVAVSADATAPDYELSARVAVAFIRQMLQYRPAPGTVYSINVPRGVDEADLQIVVAPMGGSYVRFGFDVNLEASPPVAVPRFRVGEAEAGSDTDAYNRGRVTVTPLRFDWTDRPALREMQAWDLRVRE